jgi:hypothetical protein
MADNMNPITLGAQLLRLVVSRDTVPDPVRGELLAVWARLGREDRVQLVTCAHMIERLSKGQPALAR